MMPQDSVLRQVAELPRLTFDQIQARWRELYGNEPPSYNKAQLVKRLAYRVQELAYGGLSDTARTLLEAGDGPEADANVGQRRRRARKQHLPVPGTRLVREWNGRTHHTTSRCSTRASVGMTAPTGRSAP